MANIKSQSTQTTITLKVNLRCCLECVQRMKRLLRKIKGMESSSIDVKKGILIVSGHFDHPNKIVDKIRRKGKCVTLFSIQVDDQPETTTTSAKASTQPHIKCDESDKHHEEWIRSCCHTQQRGADGNHMCELHGGQSKLHICGANFGQNIDEPAAAADDDVGVPSGVENEHQCGAHECERGRICTKDGHFDCSCLFCTEEGVETDLHCHCRSGEWPHYPCSWSAFSESHGDNRVHFDAAHNFNPNQAGFDSVHYSCRHYPEIMPHYHGQIPQQQFQNDPMDFVAQFFSDDNPLGCWMM